MNDEQQKRQSGRPATLYNPNNLLLMNGNNDLLKFKLQKDPNGLFKCTVKDCRGTFLNKRDGIAHYKTHRNFWVANNKYACRFCNQLFNTKSNKNEHERRHLNIKLYKCQTCGLRFYRSNNTRRHKKVCKGKIERDFPDSCENPR